VRLAFDVEIAREPPSTMTFHVYKHTGDPEGGLIEDSALASEAGFATFEDACEATRDLLADHHLVMLDGPYSGRIVSIRRPGASEWLLRPCW
jgi:hypothetical protein